MSRDSAAAASTIRYAKKREAIIAAATDVLNKQGVKGMTLAEVAAQVGLNTTSVTYYFRKKEDLAAACFLAGIERMNAIIADAASVPTLRGRIERFITLFLNRHARRRVGEDAPLISFMDIRTLEEPHYGIVSEAFSGMVRAARDMLEPLGISKADQNARAFLLLDQVFWSAGWLLRYDVEDYPRVGARMLDIAADGLLRAGAPWPPRLLTETVADATAGDDSARATFLTASTRLINRLGYRGASVEKISAELNVTKGSFYHHNEAKDELVLACFERTDAVVRMVQRAAIEGPGDAGEKIAAATATLIDCQMSDAGPLLRTLALNSLPDILKSGLIERSARTTERFAAMIADGVSEGVVRPVDPAIAAHMLKVAINAAADIESWVKGATRAEGVRLLALPTLRGLLAR